jgi:hypothetical protein
MHDSQAWSWSPILGENMPVDSHWVDQEIFVRAFFCALEYRPEGVVSGHVLSVL